MQPTQRFKKTLLAGALILGTGITFNASADLFVVSAEAVPDVAVSTVVGTQVSFGTGVIGNKSGESCIMAGISDVDDADMLFDAIGDASNPNSGNLITATALTGNACINGANGEAIVLEIDGADASTVTVSVPDVTGTGWVYTPTAESCVVDFDRGNDILDICQPLTSNTVTGVGMSLTQVDGASATVDELPNTATGYAAMSGKTRMILAGSITLSADLGQGTIISDNILVQVTYE
ncbi:hypothetical protein [uncultured Paraglaciecola sp.]|uniref:hypothetical protein n=1 Tax=uncultured Paraglaciecola sp. TaxID=1765024 RepID=UPI0030DBF4E0|tara:strand:+ start:19807 stop:20514 length:708 start_codon:yes stop_codon:yes gene_type:complete